MNLYRKTSNATEIREMTDVSELWVTERDEAEKSLDNLPETGSF